MDQHALYMKNKAAALSQAKEEADREAYKMAQRLCVGCEVVACKWETSFRTLDAVDLCEIGVRKIKINGTNI
jgi:hypothetical protein